MPSWLRAWRHRLGLPPREAQDHPGIETGDSDPTAPLRLGARVPQAWRVVVPPTFGFFVMFIKDTALASQIGVMELTSAGKVLTNKGFSSWLVYGTVLALYFVMSYPLSRLGKRLERKLAATRNR